MGALEHLKEGIAYLIALGALALVGFGFLLGSSGMFVKHADLADVQTNVADLARQVQSLNNSVIAIQQEIKDKLASRDSGEAPAMTPLKHRIAHHARRYLAHRANSRTYYVGFSPLKPGPALPDPNHVAIVDSPTDRFCYKPGQRWNGTCQ